MHLQVLENFPPWTLYLLAGLMGAVLGSFAGVCIWRMPRDESVVWPPSHCPACGRRLSWWENIPLVSYAILRARCRTCRAWISPRYPIVELAMVLLSLFAWWHFQEPLRYLVYLCLFILPMLIVTGIDLYHCIIPDSITIPGIAAGFIVKLLLDGGEPACLWRAVDSLAGIVVGGGALYLVALAYEKIRRQEGLGGGDVKLIAMIGAFFGWKAALLALFIASFLGSFVGLIVVIALRKDLKYAIPFGPFLATAGVVYLFFGDRLIAWYARFF
ncbi:MAG: prepilin peptidase [Proteobacteria bacterium]|nr:prepilin peptidase [Pseudomonadota bacterium]